MEDLPTLLRRSDGRASVANWGWREGGELTIKETDRAKSLTTFSVLYYFAGKIRKRNRTKHTHSDSEAVAFPKCEGYLIPRLDADGGGEMERNFTCSDGR